LTLTSKKTIRAKRGSMKIHLSSSWDLSTDLAVPSHDRPVLVNRTTGQAFGPADIVMLYPSYGLMLACEAVRRLAKTKNWKLDEDGLILIAQFCK
jgi:hypothetical protein